MKKLSTKFIAVAIVVIMLATLIPTFAVSGADLIQQEGVEVYGTSWWGAVGEPNTSANLAPGMAVDGDEATRWAPYRDDYEPYIYVTFPQVETVAAARLEVFRSNAADGGTTRATHIQFYYSATAEGDNWTRIMEVIDPTGYVVGDEETNHELFAFPAPVNARRLRLNLVEWMPGANQGLEEPPGQHRGVQPSIWAFEAFASVATDADVQARIAAMEALESAVAGTGNIFRGRFDSALEALREVEAGNVAAATLAFNESTLLYEVAQTFTEMRATLESLLEEAVEEFGDDPARFTGSGIPNATVNNLIAGIDNARRELVNNNPFDMPLYIERLEDAIEDMREAADGVDLPPIGETGDGSTGDGGTGDGGTGDGGTGDGGTGDGGTDGNGDGGDFPFVIVGVAGGVLVLVVIIAVVIMGKKKK